MKNQIKILLAGMVMAGFFFSALRTEAYPPFVRKAEKFGAKDCLFCHKEPGGGEGWNDRGNWLIAEKDKRKADAIDVEWLADYKPAGEAPKGDEKKPEEKKPEVAAVDHSAHNHTEAATKPAAEVVMAEKSAQSTKKSKTKLKQK